MITFERENDSLTFSDPPYIHSVMEYRGLLQYLMRDFLWRTSQVAVTATKGHLAEICEKFQNIPKPSSEHIQPHGFVWVGDDAMMITKNIILALQHEESFVIQTLYDYRFELENK